MRLAVISFTRAGGLLCGRLVTRARELGFNCRGYVMDRFFHILQDVPGICPLGEPVAEWTRTWFDQVDGLVYIGAAGIAVRAVAPCLKDKMTDPAVVVIDEKGDYVVSLLSGHIGGANELAAVLADMLGAVPVITTASDVRQKTAVDVWAKARGLGLSDRVLAKQVAASLLDGEPVGFFSDYPLSEPVPEGFCQGEPCRMNVWITARRRPEETSPVFRCCTEGRRTLRLIPRTLTVGVGCRRGVEGARVMRAVTRAMEQADLDLKAVANLASIDIKKEEAGIWDAAKELGVPFLTFSSEKLNEVPGMFTPSDFVRQVTGTDNVCERSALAGAGAGAVLLVRKQAADGVTIAVAQACPEIGETALEQDKYER